LAELGFRFSGERQGFAIRFSTRTALFALVLMAQMVMAQSATLTILVLDENSVPVPAARVTLQELNAGALRCETELHSFEFRKRAFTPLRYPT